MYSFSEINQIYRRCKTFHELEKASSALADVIEDGDLSQDKVRYAKMQSHIKFRQLII